MNASKMLGAKAVMVKELTGGIVKHLLKTYTLGYFNFKGKSRLMRTHGVAVELNAGGSK